MMTEGKPWAYIAHKGGYWGGISSADRGKREIAKFLADFISKGFTITPVADRDEYGALLDQLKPWGTQRRHDPQQPMLL